MTRLVGLLASLAILGGLTACCCPCVVNPGQPVVINPPPIDPPVVIAPPPPREDKIPNLIDPPNILDIKVEPMTAYAKDTRFSFVDLSTKGNFGRLQDAVFPDNHLGELIPGVHVAEGVPFRVQERYLLLRNASLIANLGVGGKMRRLHVCHAAHQYGNGNRAIAHYVLRYTDNTKAVFPVFYERHMINWWFDGKRPLPPESKIAWRGSNPPAKEGGYEVILYLTTFDNPHPQKTVHTIDFAFGDGGGAFPFCVAMTVEK